MYEAIIIIIIIAAILLIGVILIQNPKGGGLGQSFGGISNQFMGVKRTTDFLEKSTWVLVGIVAGLSLIIVFFINRNTGTIEKPKSALEGMEMSAPAPVLPPANNTNPAAPQNNMPADTGK